MIRQSTIELLKEMRFGGMASELERQQKDTESYRDMPFDDRLAMLVDAEWNRRQANKYNRCVHNARFAIPGATVEGIEYFEDRKLSILNPGIISSSREPAETVRPISPVRSVKLPAGNCTVYGTSACRSCWKN